MMRAKLKRRITNPRKMHRHPPVFPGCEMLQSVQYWKPPGKLNSPVEMKCTVIFGGKTLVYLGKDMACGIYTIDDYYGNVIGKTEVQYSHRYWLSWIFDPSKPLMFALMLNPSTATHEKLDNTIRGMLRRAWEWGYGGLVVVNVYAYRATKPTDMPKGRPAIGHWNDAYIRQAMIMARNNGIMICGWGGHKEAVVRGKLLAAKATALGLRLHALWINGDGSPKHPLYISFVEKPKPWSPLSDEAVEALSVRKRSVTV